MRASSLYPAVQTALAAVGDRCGQVGPPGTEDKQNESLRLVAAELKKAGYCADRWADSVAIKASDGLYEEWHVVYFGNGCLIDGYNAFKAAWPYKGIAPTPSSCPPPQPERNAWNLRISIELKAAGWRDATLTTVGTCDYCAQVGLGDYGGTIRCGCPMRKEEDPNRLACELYAMGGAIWWQTIPASRSIELKDGNQWVARCDGCDQMRVCAKDGLVCSEWK